MEVAGGMGAAAWEGVRLGGGDGDEGGGWGEGGQMRWGVGWDGGGGGWGEGGGG